jgi:hypothetical protein
MVGVHSAECIVPMHLTIGYNYCLGLYEPGRGSLWSSTMKDYISAVPTEEESGMLVLSSSVNVHMCGWVGEKGDVRGQTRGWARLENGTADPEHGPVVEVWIFVQRATTPSKRGFYYFTNFTTHTVPDEDGWFCWCHLCKYCNLICGVWKGERKCKGWGSC